MKSRRETQCNSLTNFAKVVEATAILDDLLVFTRPGLQLCRSTSYPCESMREAPPSVFTKNVTLFKLYECAIDYTDPSGKLTGPLPPSSENSVNV
jgi:hypothetical protein